MGGQSRAREDTGMVYSHVVSVWLTWVSSATTQIEAFNGRSVVTVRGAGACKVQLIEGHGSVENVLQNITSNY